MVSSGARPYLRPEEHHDGEQPGARRGVFHGERIVVVLYDGEIDVRLRRAGQRRAALNADADIACGEIRGGYRGLCGVLWRYMGGYGGDKVGGQAVLGRQIPTTTPWLTERHGYDPT